MTAFVNEHLSVSRLRKYEECPRAFYFRYVEKDPDPIPEDETAPRFGKAIHAVLESYFKSVLEREYRGPIELDAIMRQYRQSWSESGLTGVETYRDGLEILRAYAQSNPLVDHWNILDVEKEFKLPVSPSMSILGYIDRVDRVDDEAIRVEDYKTNRKLYTRQELETDLQLSVYGWAVRQLYPHAKRVEFAFRMLRHDAVQRVHRTKEQMDDVAGYVADLGVRTESDTAWEPRLNPNCSFCASRRRCDLYKKALAGGHEYARGDKDHLPELAQERAVVQNVAKAAYARKDRIDEVFKRALLSTDAEVLQVGGFEIKNIPAFETTFPRSVVELFVSYGRMPASDVMDRILRVDRDAVKDLQSEISESRGREAALLLSVSLEAAEVRTPKTSRLDVRKLK